MKVKIITEAYIGKSDEPSLEDLIRLGFQDYGLDW